jgi:hypothetical protein
MEVRLIVAIAFRLSLSLSNCLLLFFSDVYHDNTKIGGKLPSYDTGSTVTFTLNLTDQGSLHASVDGKPAVELFSNMFECYDSIETGFVPAVSIRRPGRVWFLGFE